ncbi:MAG: hypothetical protein K5988_00955 [Lachnospiraceae bacterium]|nr:hypothetical protein [Lachnospiraceae bacterium]
MTFKSILEFLNNNAIFIDIISCVFTVIALVFTLYLWLLDQRDDEKDYVENKREYIQKLDAIINNIDDRSNPAGIVEQMGKADSVIEEVISYRFWANTPHYKIIKEMEEFHKNSKYYISALKRISEQLEEQSIFYIDVNQKLELRNRYIKKLSYFINFLKNDEWL